MMDTPTIYIEELGYRNAVSEKDQIVWFWEQRVKKYDRQNHRTRYWLDLLEKHEKRLLKLQAYELLQWLKSKVTEEQVTRRQEYRLLSKAKSQIEIDGWRDYFKQQELKKELLTIHLN